VEGSTALSRVTTHDKGTKRSAPCPVGTWEGGGTRLRAVSTSSTPATHLRTEKEVPVPLGQLHRVEVEGGEEETVEAEAEGSSTEEPRQHQPHPPKAGRPSSLPRRNRRDLLLSVTAISETSFCQ
jgi:hypothetical protein